MGPKNPLIEFVSPSVSDTPSLTAFHLIATHGWALIQVPINKQQVTM